MDITMAQRNRSTKVTLCTDGADTKTVDLKKEKG